MGCFDRFYDHAGREHQTKAFGKTLGRHDIGDQVTVRRAPTTEAELDAWLAGTFDGTPEEVHTTYQVVAAGPDLTDDVTFYIDVADDTFTGISRRRNRQVPLYGYLGELVREHLRPVSVPPS